MTIRHAPLRLRGAGGEVGLVRFLAGRSGAGASDARADLAGDGVRVSSSIMRRNTSSSGRGFGDGVRMSSRSKVGVGVAGSGALARASNARAGLVGEGVRKSSCIMRRNTGVSSDLGVSSE